MASVLVCRCVIVGLVFALGLSLRSFGLVLVLGFGPCSLVLVLFLVLFKSGLSVLSVFGLCLACGVALSLVLYSCALRRSCLH